MNKLIPELKKSFVTALWFAFLTFPILVIKVNTVRNSILWRWGNLAAVFVLTMALSYVWRRLLEKRARGERLFDLSGLVPAKLRGIELKSVFAQKKNSRAALAVLLALAVLFPFVAGMYQTNIVTTALMYVILGLGLNIVIGLGGLLQLGYAAFYAVGAYTYGILNTRFGLSFWIALPLGAVLATIFGIILGFPVLRLKGDYLAIVTLGFAEICRIVLENWNDFSSGPSGISQIDRPPFFGIKLSVPQSAIYLYLITLALVVVTVFIVRRLENSRLGRAWEAMREDAVASEAMGVNLTIAKLSAFALGAFWAGMVGVLFAAKTTFINPASFTLMESVLILCIIVLGGMGSTAGVIVGALVIILLPEYLRAFTQYRMLLYGSILVLMMVFRPGGIIRKVRKSYVFKADGQVEGAGHE
ncbi:MAG TPA: high-affinity branched-chain amino acid ABC transporter permease LivM [Spirochaetia bacterium]|nr:high-affinity branched-chain amino acid ABC transporter permease LivM [Spirochaetales bacterium]HRY80957.1 high-affinity branched-chain amino acid ABC transporter permease LivM [Spirochaetia bacterium]